METDNRSGIITEMIRDQFDSSEFIPLHAPKFGGNEKKYLNECIDTTYVSSVGAFVDLFEKKMCEITGAKYAIAIVNGTNALHLALILAGVQPGDEVLTQPLSFIATANAISYCNAHPHFVDVDKETLGLSPSACRKHLQEVAEIRNGNCYNKITNRRISACVPMHTFGLPMYIDELKELCDEYHIPIVEDAAESLGSYYKDRHTGTFGLLGTFSFNGNKTVTCGGGGAIITNDEALAKRAKHLSTQAKVPHAWEFVHDEIGYNYRMPNLNAALACAQLEQLNEFVENKRNLSGAYESFFRNLEGVQFVKEIPGAKSNYWLNAIIFDTMQARDHFLEFSNRNEVMTRPVWQLMNKLVMFKDCFKSDLSQAEWLAERIVNIPSSVRTQ
jgi:aminotransferase in exopolysaccharide biosynthesis